MLSRLHCQYKHSPSEGTLTKAVAGEKKQSWSILGSRCWPMEVAGQQVVKKNVFQMSEVFKSVPSSYANNMGGDTVEAGKKSFPPNEVKEERTLQKCDT